jgi:hypothetical protein
VSFTMPQRHSRFLAVLALAAVAAGPQAARKDPGHSAPAKVDFTRDVRPILAGRCFRCHGPDDKVRKAKLRLDVRADATRGRGRGAVIVPGEPAKSKLLARVGSDDETLVMPPAGVGKRLSAREVAVLKRWIEQGAEYATHWAYLKPVRPRIPAVRDPGWARNPIDRFILARLEKEGLRPTPPADRYAIARRLALDLAGLPPTLQDADEFIQDKRPGAYERLVDRLLASPAYGERWALVWLDLARYADSQGYANDPERTIWSYRDWVIRALNDNLPYDRFTIEQLAGDLLANPTRDQLVATGFHRNTLTNTEGGVNPEEFRSAAVVDRVNTTFQVWLGTTLACAQCHNHKYDPFSQKEYYQVYAILNNTEDNNAGNDAPVLTLATPGMQALFEDVTVRLNAAKRKRDVETRRVDAEQGGWEKMLVVASLPKDVAAVLAVPAVKRNAAQQQKLTAYHRGLSKTWAALDAEVRTLEARLRAVTTATPILREGKPRPTHVHIRGNHEDKGEAAFPGLPAALPAPRDARAPVNRLTLANWLVDGENPLTARVAVNRLWEELFGVGIVETSEEFGLQGELPSHPELLDWLATEYVRLNWDTKQMLKLIVTSAAYRQGAQVTPELARRDPNNRLLARGPRVRLSGEAVRDQALFAAGLLSRKLYGPPVQPPQPPSGLAAAFGSSTDWQTSPGEDRHRRGLYTRWRRSSPYAPLTTFDAPERSTCSVRRVRTNTPLQALVTLNDPVFFEAAQGLARRIAAHRGSVRERVVHGFRLCLTRPPSERETERLAALFTNARRQLAETPAKAATLATKPLGPAPSGLDVIDLAAWTVVANVLLNLDETIAKR